MVELLGEYIYDTMKQGKSFRLLFFMTMGKMPDERSTIAVVVTLCNVLYGCAILFGFCVLNRNVMLVLKLVTLHIGPAMILIVLSIVVQYHSQ